MSESRSSDWLHLGDVAQIASARHVRFDGGPEDGVRAVDVRVAGGIDAMVLVDRGMDLGPAWCAGQQIAWISPTGPVHPASGSASNWLEAFHGGLLTTCGMRNVGPPCEHEGETHGLHGRASGLQARNVTARTVFESGRPVVEVTGELRETAVFGPDLVLHRRLRFPSGEKRIEIRDTITNNSSRPEPLFLLYHFNLGWPVVSSESTLEIPPHRTTPRDDLAMAALDEYNRFTPPTAGAPPQVFEHHFSGRATDTTVVGVVNRQFAPTNGIGAAVQFDQRQLPRFWQWRNLAIGSYLTGIEPANCGVAGRREELDQLGAVDIVEPGDQRQFDLVVMAATGPDVEALASRCRGESHP